MTQTTSAQPSSAQRYVLNRCAVLPEAELTRPFGEQTAVFKVGGKMFAAVSTEETPGAVTLKSEPAHAAALTREHRQITPGYHMNKRHWITIELDSGLAQSLIGELIEQSYDLVVAGLPAKRRPA
jgi:predicted DNA-binding protein (MmcQ/YjbR family)